MKPLDRVPLKPSLRRALIPHLKVESDMGTAKVKGKVKSLCKGVKLRIKVH